MEQWPHCYLCVCVYLYLSSDASSQTLKNGTRRYGIQTGFPTLCFIYRKQPVCRQKRTEATFSQVGGVEEGKFGQQLFITCCLPQNHTKVQSVCHLHAVIFTLRTPEIIKLLCTFQICLKKNNLLLLYILYHTDVFVRKLLCPSPLS